MKAIAAFLLVNAAIVLVNMIGAGVALGLGMAVNELGLGESQLAWAITGMLATGGAVSAAARLAGIGRGA